MTLNDYKEIEQNLTAAARAIAEGKRPGYVQGNADVLHNFKSVADRMGITPMQAWGVYFLKHIDALASLAKDPAIPQAEAIEGRFCDAINYLHLGYALVVEGEKGNE